MSNEEIIEFTHVQEAVVAINTATSNISKEVIFLTSLLKEKNDKIEQLKAELEELRQKRHKLNKLDQPIERIMGLRKALNNLFNEGYLNEATE